MRLKLEHFLLAAILFLTLGACNSFEKIRKSTDVNMKLAKANEYYDKKQYFKANELYSDLRGVLRNTRNYEALYIRYAYSFYYMKDFISASYHFKNFVEYFPNSKDADDAEFMHGICLWKNSPNYTLDQTNTIKALESLQSYINTHPNSKHIAEASSYVDQCRGKLETKEAAAAELYFNIGQYKAAGISYKSIMRNYPESSNSDKYLYMTIRSTYKYAEASIPEKQEERYTNAMSIYRELIDTYPKSKYISEAEKIYSLADNNIKRIRNEHK